MLLLQRFIFIRTLIERLNLRNMYKVCTCIYTQIYYIFEKIQFKKIKMKSCHKIYTCTQLYICTHSDYVIMCACVH